MGRLTHRTSVRVTSVPPWLVAAISIRRGLGDRNGNRRGELNYRVRDVLHLPPGDRWVLAKGVVIDHRGGSRIAAVVDDWLGGHLLAVALGAVGECRAAGELNDRAVTLGVGLAVRLVVVGALRVAVGLE